MIRAQVEILAVKLLEAIDDVVDMETNEGLRVYQSLLATLNTFHPDYIKDKVAKQLIQTTMKGIE